MNAYDWYFDLLSPFAYLQFKVLQRKGLVSRLRMRPVLFAALLEHWGHVGPAEMPTKRLFTYQHCLWLAHQHGIAMTLPPEHPFNPLPLLRLAAATQVDGAVPEAVVAELFDFVWRDGHLPRESAPFAALMQRCGATDAMLSDPAVKQALRANGDEAIAHGVFGVPTTVVGKQLLWGVDSTAMLEAVLAHDPFFDSDGYRSAANVGAGITRSAKPA